MFRFATVPRNAKVDNLRVAGARVIVRPAP
jgi:hypothetical protein